MDKVAIYEQLYAHYRPITTQEDRIVQIMKFLGTKHYDRFLDIACGDGGLTLEIARTIGAKEIKTVELSVEGSEKAKARNLDCRKIDLDRDQLPFADNSFDFVFCGDIIEHLFDPEKMVEEIHRVLAPGGKLMITTPNLCSWINRIYLLLGYNPVWCSASIKHHDIGKLFNKSTGVGIEHIRFFSLKALKDILNYNDFNVLNTFGFCVATNATSSRQLNSLLNGVDYLFSKKHSLASIVGAFCEKRK